LVIKFKFISVFVSAVIVHLWLLDVVEDQTRI